MDLRTILETNLGGPSKELQAPQLDDYGRQVTAMAPNAIEWCVGESWAASDSLYTFTRSYQMIRDYFGLRCPLCNPGTSDPGQPGDCWGRSRTYLEDEVLLRWSVDAGEDVCPKCHVTRSELIEDGLLKPYNQLHLVCGMRCVNAESTHVYTQEGLLTVAEVIARDTPAIVLTRAAPRPTDAAALSGPKPSLEIRTTRAGYLSVSEEHRFLVAHEDLSETWVEARDLRLGETLVMRTGVGLFGSRELPEDVAWLLGVLVAVGRRRGEAIEIKSRIAEVVPFTLAALQRLAAQNSWDAAPFDVAPTSFAEGSRVLIQSPDLEALLVSCECSLPDPEQRSVPLAVRCGTREVVRHFLRGFLLAGGFCRRIKDRSAQLRRPVLGYECWSLQLTLQVNLLLANFGILVTRNTGSTRARRTSGRVASSHYIRVASESLDEALRLFGSLEEGPPRQPQRRRKYGPCGSARWALHILDEVDRATGAFCDESLRFRGGSGRKAFGAANLARLYDEAKSARCALSQKLAQELLTACNPWLSTEVRARLEAYCDPTREYVVLESVRPGPEVFMGDLSVPEARSFTANGLVTHNSGKSMTAGLIGNFCEHFLLSIAHNWPGGLHGYLGITPAEKFEMTFLASNQVQSEDTIWAKYTGFRSQAPWFKRYVPWIKALEAQQPRFGMRAWRYDEGVKRIINEHPNVRLIINALNSNSSGQAGRTRVHGFVDELARMKRTNGTQGAAEIYRTIEASLRTVRSRVLHYGGVPWLGSMISVTSPIARDDKAMTLLRDAPYIPGMFARLFPTWEFNPLEPRENFAAEFAKDPVGAARDFGASPPGAEHPLIHNDALWYAAAVDEKLTPRAVFATYGREDPTGMRYVAAKLVSSQRSFQVTAPRYIVFDAGKNFDAFAGACAHEETRTHDDGTEYKVTVYDWVFRIVPEPGAEVWFDSVVDIMTKLKGNFHIARVVFDRWNSVQLIQNIRELGIRAEQESLHDKDFIDWKIDCFSGYSALLPPKDVRRNAAGQVEFPLSWTVNPEHMSPETAAIYELLGLQRDPDTLKVYNPDKGKELGRNSDDAARVVVHVHRLVQRADYTERQDDRARRSAQARVQHGGASWGGYGTVSRGGSRTW